MVAQSQQAQRFLNPDSAIANIRVGSLYKDIGCAHPIFWLIFRPSVYDSPVKVQTKLTAVPPSRAPTKLLHRASDPVDFVEIDSKEKPGIYSRYSFALSNQPRSEERLRLLAGSLSTASQQELPGIFQKLEAALGDPGASVVSCTPLSGDHVNKVFTVTLSNGAVGIFKPANGEEPRRWRQNCDPGRQGSREKAAYLVDKAMGHLGRIPPTVDAVIPDLGEGTLMYFIPKAETAKSAGDFARCRIEGDFNNPHYRRLAILDNVIGNLDRHARNWMITEDGGVVPIDHGLSFPLKNSSQGPLRYSFPQRVPLAPDDLQRLQSLIENRRQLDAELSSLLQQEAIDCLFERVEKMLADGHTSTWWH